jgi:hypothetical protein
MDPIRQFRTTFAAPFAGIEPVTLRAWSTDGKFVMEADIAETAGGILKFAPESRRKPIAEYRWGAYTYDDLLRLTLICRLRENGWALDAAVAAVGRELLQGASQRPLKTLVISRVKGAFRVHRCWDESQVAQSMREPGFVKTVIGIDQLREEVEARIAEADAADAGDGKEPGV